MLAAGLIIVVAACDILGSSAGPPSATQETAPAPTGPSTSGGPADGTYAEFAPDAALLAAATAEGFLTTMALPLGSCSYAEVIDTFKQRTGLPVQELIPDARSAEVIAALEASRDDPSLGAPDVVEIEFLFAADAKGRDLLQPYKVTTWDSIPASAKDADGQWYGAYYGVMAFEVNTDIVTNVPSDWPDLLEDGYDAQVALSGDPRLGGEAAAAVHAAALANGGTLEDTTKGLEFFRDLNATGNFFPVIGKTGTVAAGETPIRLAWTYHALADRDALDGTAEIDVVVPTTGRLAGVNVQAISKDSPHPSAARLWMEFLYSDEGQNLLLSGSCHPIRYADLVAGKHIPPEALRALPDVAGTVFPTLAESQAAALLISSEWDDVVGADIICSLDCE